MFGLRVDVNGGGSREAGEAEGRTDGGEESLGRAGEHFGDGFRIDEDGQLDRDWEQAMEGEEEA